MSERVCVIGAGVSGLAAAKVLLADGFQVDVFERDDGLGGTWHPSRTYPDLRTNDVRELYRYSDLAYPQETDDYPTAQQVLAYLESYAEKFELRPHMEFCTEVLNVERRDDEAESEPKFRVETRRVDGEGDADEHFYDHVAVCNGVFCTPHVPDFEGDERFDGPILHSSELNDVEVVEGERIVVIGGGKSAYDCATIGGRYADACTMAFRTPHWLVPRFVFGMRADWLILPRFAQAFLPYYDEHGPSALLHSVGKPFVRLYWWIQTLLIKSLLDCPSELEPEESFLRGLRNIGAGTELYDLANAGEVTPIQSEISRFVDGETIAFENGERVEADVVVCATGWEQPLDFLSPELQQVTREDSYFKLFRHIIPPEEPDLGFIGYAASLGNTLTSELSAHWLSSCFLGELDLPDRDTMRDEIETANQWSEQWLPGTSGGHLIAAHIMNYYEQILRDMDLPTHQADNLLEEYFGRLHADRFADIGEQRRQTAR